MNELTSSDDKAGPAEMLCDRAETAAKPCEKTDCDFFNELDDINSKIIELNEKFLILHKKWFLERKKLVYSPETKIEQNIKEFEFSAYLCKFIGCFMQKPCTAEEEIYYKKALCGAGSEETDGEISGETGGANDDNTARGGVGTPLKNGAAIAEIETINGHIKEVNDEITRLNKRREELLK
jgi:hypothetical protein